MLLFVQEAHNIVVWWHVYFLVDVDVNFTVNFTVNAIVVVWCYFLDVDVDVINVVVNDSVGIVNYVVIWWWCYC